MSKIEPLVICDGGGYESIRADYRADWLETPFSVVVHGEMKMTRKQFSALIRWGARALAVTHPDLKRAEPCDHRRTFGRGELMICADCNEVVK